MLTNDCKAELQYLSNLSYSFLSDIYLRSNFDILVLFCSNFIKNNLKDKLDHMMQLNQF